MSKIKALKGNTDYDSLKSWCLTVYEYLLSISPDFEVMVNGEYGFMSVIKKADKTHNIKLMKSLYKETSILVREDMLSSENMNSLNQLLKEKFGHNIADEMDLEIEAIQNIIKRGKIHNDREFEMVKRREEEIFTDESQSEYAETLRQLMADYE